MAQISSQKNNTTEVPNLSRQQMNSLGEKAATFFLTVQPSRGTILMRRNDNEMEESPEEPKASSQGTDGRNDSERDMERTILLE